MRMKGRDPITPPADPSDSCSAIIFQSALSCDSIPGGPEVSDDVIPNMITVVAVMPTLAEADAEVTRLTALNGDGDPKQAFATLVGKDLATFEKDWDAYLTRLQPNGTLAK